MAKPLTSNPRKLSANGQWVRRISAEWRDESNLLKFVLRGQEYMQIGPWSVGWAWHMKICYTTSVQEGRDGAAWDSDTGMVQRNIPRVHDSMRQGEGATVIPGFNTRTLFAEKLWCYNPAQSRMGF
jgi:hypothetical protein